jgi:UDP-N-acetylmuramate dehydrogenase
MTFPDLIPDLRPCMPELRGRLLANQPLADLTWFRVGGPAQLMFIPEDEPDLAYFLARLPPDIAVTVIGLGSNLIVRDGGVPGVVIRLGRGFNGIAVEPGHRIRAGAAVPDVKVARAAQEAAVAGLSFLRGIPGAVGGALRMNGGAYGGETRDVLVEARGVDRAGRIQTFANADMHYAYRHCGVAEDVIFTQALFAGSAGDGAPTGQEPHRRLDLQEPAGPQGVAAHRCRRLPRLDAWRRPGIADALQFPDQPRRRQRRRHRNARRNGAHARARNLRHRS